MSSLAYGTAGTKCPEFYDVDHCSNLPLAASVEHRLILNDRIVAKGIARDAASVEIEQMRVARRTAAQYRSKEGS